MKLEVQVRQKTRKKKGGALLYKEKPTEAPAEAQVFLDGPAAGKGMEKQ